MKFATVKTILMAAQSNQQHGVIKTHNNDVCFSFAHGGGKYITDTMRTIMAVQHENKQQ